MGAALPLCKRQVAKPNLCKFLTKTLKDLRTQRSWPEQRGKGATATVHPTIEPSYLQKSPEAVVHRAACQHTKVESKTRWARRRRSGAPSRPPRECRKTMPYVTS